MSANWEGVRRIFRLALGRRGRGGRRAITQEIGEELQFHLDERIEELMVAGLSRAAAESEARTRLGDRRRLEGQLQRIDRGRARREALGEALGALARDLRVAIRGLRRNPGFALAAVATLGLGMGVTGAVYTLLRRIVLDPLSYPASERLVRLRNPVPGVEQGGEWNLSTAQFFYYRQRVPEFEELGLYDRGGINLSGPREPQRGTAAFATASTLDLLGARAIRGRLFGAADDVPGAPAVAVVSYGLWRSLFGGTEGIVGQSLRVNDEPVPIIGVMAPGVELPPELGETIAAGVDLWLPTRLNPAGPFRNNHVFSVVGRLAPGATLEAAQHRIAGLRSELPQAFPDAYSEAFLTRYGFRTVLYPLKQYVLGDMARNLWILFGAVALVLVIACANTANLLFARLETRRREFALRSAIGASRGHIAREALAEGAVLALAGAAVGLGVNVAATRWLVRLSPPGVPRLETLAVDWRILLFLVGLAALVALVLALLPVVQYRGLTALSLLGEGARGTAAPARQRLRGGLVVAQVALALMLVVGSGLLLRSFQRLRAVDPGVDPRGVLTLEWYLPYPRYDSLSTIWRFHQRVLGQIRALPGVVAAGASEELPLLTGFGCTVQGFEETVVYDRIKDAGLTTCAGQAPTTPGYFEALRIPLLEGRFFTDADNTAPERGAVIVTRAFARRFWPGEDPIGKGVNPNGRSKPPFYHVVGVVGDLQGTSLDEPPAQGIFYPVVAIPGAGRWYPSAMHLVVRVARGDPLTLLPAIRRIVTAADPTIPLAHPEPMQALLHRSMARLSFTMMLLGVSGVLALALAAIGLYGVISYVVARRAHEIGVRMALGARAAQVERLVLNRAWRWCGIGLLLGTGGALLSARVLRGLLYGVAPWDPASYLAAAALLLGVASLAGWLPARRAARVDPARALREE